MKKFLQLIFSIFIIVGFAECSAYNTTEDEAALKSTVKNVYTAIMANMADNMDNNPALLDRVVSIDKIKAAGCGSCFDGFTLVKNDMTLYSGSITLKSIASGKTATINFNGEMEHSFQQTVAKKTTYNADEVSSGWNSASRELTIKKLKNIGYYISTFGREVRLVGGAFESHGTPLTNNNYIRTSIGEIVFGDLNGDGVDDAAVILISSGGGSGLFYDLSIVINNNGHPYTATSRSLGDRVQINSMSIESQMVIIDDVVSGPYDPACCPTLKTKSRYKLSENGSITLDGSERLNIYVEPFRNPGDGSSMYADPESIKFTYGLWYLILKTFFIFPDFDIHFKYCGTKNAYFNHKGIIMCNEYVADFVNHGVEDALQWVFFHEVGHALPYYWDDPMYSNEDAADEFATAILLMMDDMTDDKEDTYKEIIETSIRQKKTNSSFFESLTKLLVDDRHSTSVQRSRNISNWLNDAENLKRQWFKKLIPNIQTATLKEFASNPRPWMDVYYIQKELRGRGE